MKPPFVETEFSEEPLTAIRMVMQSHSTGQLVLNVSQGTVISVKWRERATPVANSLDSKETDVRISSP